MRFLVIGASGNTGQLVISEALGRGHTVTALVRSESSLPLNDKNITVVKGTPLTEADVDTALTAAPEKPDAVIITLKARRTSESPFSAMSADSPEGMMTTAAKNAMAAMRRHGVRKLVVMSSIGVGSSRTGTNFLVRMMLEHTSMRFEQADHNGVEAAVKEESQNKSAGGLDFVLVRPAMLTEGELAAVKVFPDTAKGAGFMPSVSRKSVAKFLVDAAETDKYNGQMPVITN